MWMCFRLCGFVNVFFFWFEVILVNWKRVELFGECLWIELVFDKILGWLMVIDWLIWYLMV